MLTKNRTVAHQSQKGLARQTAKTPSVTDKDRTKKLETMRSYRVDRTRKILATGKLDGAVVVNHTILTPDQRAMLVLRGVKERNKSVIARINKLLGSMA